MFVIESREREQSEGLMRRTVAALRVWLMAAVIAAVSSASAEDWPQFRGPNASGVAADSTNPPVKFSSEENVAWSVELGRGVACPIVVDGRVFATTMTDDAKCGDGASDRPISM